MPIHMDITALVKSKKVELDVVVERFVFGMFARVIMRSPVDTGRFRANWVLGFGTPTPVTVLTDDQGPVTSNGSGQSSTKNGVAAELKGRDWVGKQIVYLTNSLPYSYYLEYGKMTRDGMRPGSQQAPQGMVRLTVNEYSEVLNNSKPYSL